MVYKEERTKQLIGVDGTTIVVTGGGRHYHFIGIGKILDIKCVFRCKSDVWIKLRDADGTVKAGNGG